MTQALKDEIIAAADRRSRGIPTLEETPYGFRLTVVGLNSDEPEEDGDEDEPSLRDEVEQLIASHPDPDALNPGNTDYEVLWTDPEGNETYIDINARYEKCEDCGAKLLPSQGFCADDTTLCRACAAKDAAGEEEDDGRERPVKAVEFMAEHVHVLYADGAEECCLARNWNRCTAGKIDWDQVPDADETIKYYTGDDWETIGREA